MEKLQSIEQSHQGGRQPWSRDIEVDREREREREGEIEKVRETALQTGGGGE